MAFKLTVPNVDTRTFYAYWYGTGDLESVDGVKTEDWIRVPGAHTFVVNYGEDEYRCRYQDGRFASGMYFSKVEEV